MFIKSATRQGSFAARFVSAAYVKIEGFITHPYAGLFGVPISNAATNLL